jgi:hypothetical protein
MMRRTFRLGGLLAVLAAVSWCASSASGVELRGRTGMRATYRLTALQVSDDDFEQPSLEPQPADPQPAESPDAMTEDSPETPGDREAPVVPRQRGVRRPSTTPSSPYPLPMAAPVWDADVVPYGGASRGGPCSDGYCEECPTNTGTGLACGGTWGSLEYVVWWRKDRSSPTLVSTTSQIVNQDVDGQIGQPNTVRLLGDPQYDPHLQPGGRIDFGMWLDSCRSWGVGTSFTALANDVLNYRTTSATNPVLTVPFFNLDPAVNGEDTLVVAHPLDNSTGSINVFAKNTVNLGDVYLRLSGVCGDRYRVDLLGGYAFSNIQDEMILNTSTTTGATTVNVQDRFRTLNSYQGGMIGFLSEVDRGAWKVNMIGKVALVNVHETLVVDGNTRVNGVFQAPLSGLFAQQSNSGTTTGNDFAVVPQLTANWVYKMGYGADLMVGYSVIYWSNAALAGDQFNRRIDPTQATAQPGRQIVTSDYLVHGLNFGLTWSY